MKCVICSSEFVAKRKDSKTCSLKCRYKLHHLTRDLNRKRLTRITYDEYGNKLCGKCKKFKTVSRFYNRDPNKYKGKFSDGKEYSCIDCCNMKDRRSKEKLSTERRRKYRNATAKRQSEKLSDAYVINSMIQNLRPMGITSHHVREIVPELIEVARLNIKLQRELKNKTK